MPEHFLIIDRTNNPMEEDVLHIFAQEELWCESIAQGQMPPIAHLWRHQRAFILGLRDRTLPCAEEAMELLRKDGVSVAVRHSGGAAVVLDLGVVNVSLILPQHSGNIRHRDDFERMANLLRESLHNEAVNNQVSIKAGEISGSYCPGDFDLSVAGRKFCGISQRRKLKSLIVQAFVNVAGSGVERGEQVRRFYESAACDRADGKYPVVIPETMTSLQEWFSAYSVTVFSQNLLNALQRRGGVLVPMNQVDSPVESVSEMTELLRTRYDVR